MTSQFLINIIIQYGYVGLFMIMAITILGIPIPVEFILTFVGFLSFRGQLNPVIAILFATTGCVSGITIAYLLGLFFQHKILINLKKYAGGSRIKKVFSWYQLHGGKLLTVGYFIPGVRHLSGYIAGMSKVKYREFALYSYLGAILWTTPFIMLGRILGSRWKTLLPMIHHYALLFAILVIIFCVLLYLLYKNHEVIMLWFNKKLSHLPRCYFSLVKRRFLVTMGGLISISLFLILMGLI
ncbi:MAG: DedA family protein [Eubacteriales bacterium]